MKTERVVVQISPPTSNAEGIIAEGYYVLDGHNLTMTFASGEPVQIEGKTVERTLVGGEDPRMVAGRLTKEIRRALNGQSEVGEAFSRPINYIYWSHGMKP